MLLNSWAIPNFHDMRRLSYVFSKDEFLPCKTRDCASLHEANRSVLLRAEESTGRSPHRGAEA